MKNVFFSILVAFIFSNHLSAQYSSADILLQLQKLNTVGSVLYVAAHPDDENTRLLAYLAKERKVRTGYLSLTRGDGGQNLVGKEQGDALGLIRTQELLAARRIDGAEQFFTRANDFGYSKNPEETFSIWGKDSILADAVWVIRNFKPDVIICRFPTTGEGGHGHHTASAIIAEEAFAAAADPKRFPEQLKYTQVWQARRIFWNTFNFGTTNTTAPNQLQIDVGVYNTLLGKGFGEIASESRSMHKSQGFGSAKTRGTTIEYFKLLKGDSVKKDIFDGIDLTWKRFTQTTLLQKTLDKCIANFNYTNPALIVNDLVAAYKQIQLLDEKGDNIKYWQKVKLKEIEHLLLACSGLWMEAYANDYMAIPGESLQITMQLIKRNNTIASLDKINYWQQADTLTNLNLKNNELYTFKHNSVLNEAMAYSNPYWLNEHHDVNRFVVNNPLLIGTPENNSPVKIFFNVTIAGLSLQIQRDVVYKYTDPVKGEVYRPLEILPPVTINIAENVYAFSESSPKTIKFLIKANTNGVKGKIQLQATDGWKISITNNDFSINTKGEEVVMEALLSPNANSTKGKLTATINIDGKIYTKSIKRIEYDHIPYQFILTDAEATLVNINLKKSGLNIGYIPGAGDAIPTSLKQIGYNVTILTDEVLTNENLLKYNSIITGVRAYNTDERLQVHYNKLMDYINNGGNLIVQYNTNSRVGPMKSKIGPFPFTISRERVTDENAEVKILKPEHAVFNFPNKITNDDFSSWTQERGIYFATELDKSYETLLSMNDPNEKPLEGSLIIAKYGKGNFVYTGLSLFRQLPAGVPGAYRLLSNLLSIPVNK